MGIGNLPMDNVSVGNENNRMSIEALTITPVKFCCHVMIIIILMSIITNINIINKIKINNIIHIFNIIIIINILKYC